MRILVALPGLHRFYRGAEVAFISIANQLAKTGDVVTLIGAGAPGRSAVYRYFQVPTIDRKYFRRCPSVPLLRNEYAYEELTFAPGLLHRYQPADYDVTLT